MLRAGVDLGGTKIQVAILDPDGNVVGQCRIPTPQDAGPPGVLTAIVTAVRSAMLDAHAETSDLMGVGLGAPGQIDHAAGTVSHAGNLPDWLGTVAVTSVLRDALGVPIELANDVQVGIMAESKLGAGRPYSSLLGIFCGTGVGGGVVLNDTLWLGRGAAGEIGHMVVVPNGEKCPCGRRGCLEAYAGRSAMEIEARRRVKHGHKTDLFHIMQHKGRDRLASGVWAKALAQQDKMAKQLIHRAEWAVGIAAASAVNLLDVEAVIIGGGLGCRLGPPFVDRIRESMMPHLILPERPPQVLVAALGDLGGATGAALLVEHTVSPPGDLATVTDPDE
ncbi:MAG: ROK family protein [Candidatus Nanopelagicales bacterium]